MGSLVCGLDVHRGWCETIVDSRSVSRDELLSFLSSRMDVFLVAMESSGCVYSMYRA